MVKLLLIATSVVYLQAQFAYFHIYYDIVSFLNKLRCLFYSTSFHAVAMIAATA